MGIWLWVYIYHSHSLSISIIYTSLSSPLLPPKLRPGLGDAKAIIVDCGVLNPQVVNSVDPNFYQTWGRNWAQFHHIFLGIEDIEVDGSILGWVAGWKVDGSWRVNLFGWWMMKWSASTWIHLPKSPALAMALAMAPGLDSPGEGRSRRQAFQKQRKERPLRGLESWSNGTEGTGAPLQVMSKGGWSNNGAIIHDNTI